MDYEDETQQVDAMFVIEGTKAFVASIRESHPEVGDDPDKLLYVLSQSYLDSTMPRRYFATMVRTVLYEVQWSKPDNDDGWKPEGWDLT